MERLEPEQQRHRAAGTCGRTGAPSARGLGATGRACARHASGSWSFCVSAKVTGRPIAAGEPAHPRHLPLGRGEVLAERARGRELEHAGAELAEHAADAEQLVLGRERAGHRLAVDGHVRDRARRREAERAGVDALAHDRGHRLDVVGGRGLVAARRARPSRSRAPRRAAPACRRRAPSARGRPRRGTRGRSPSPTGCRPTSAAPGMSSTPSISPMSQSCRSGAHRREADAAVAHHDGGHAVPARRREQRVPRDLAVEVRVDVDEAGRDEQRRRRRSSRARRAVDRADLGDDAVGDRDVGGARRRPGAVDDGPALDHEIVHAFPLTDSG